VHVSLDSAQAETEVAKDGTWRVTLDLLHVGAGPFNLDVEGDTKVSVSDVVVGQVWLCSGQSNMALQVKATDHAAEDIPASADLLLREFDVKQKGSIDPGSACEGKWVVASPATTGDFTAVGYYFGRALRRQLRAPVGLLHSSWGGSSIEAWMSADALGQDSALKASTDKIISVMRSYPDTLQNYPAKFAAWAAKYGRQDHPSDPAAFAFASSTPAGWRKVTGLPCRLAQEGLPDAGAIWLRCTVQVSPAAARSYHPLHFAAGDFDEIYWNGVKVGESMPDHSTAINTTTQFSNLRRYDVPVTDLKPGENILAVRLYVPTGGAGTTPTPWKFGEPNLSFGPWLAKAEYELPPLSAEAGAAYPSPPLLPPAMPMRATYLYNGMIAPLLSYTLEGVVWYQGESNVERAAQYRVALRSLITDWRDKWKDVILPFYICQLPAYLEKKSQPGESGWAELRESQARASTFPHTHLVVLDDLGEAGNIHYRDKRDVGERIAQMALVNDYGQPGPASSPTFRAMSVEADKARLTFDHADGGLEVRPLPTTYLVQSDPLQTKRLVPNSPGSQIEGFTICGADHQWHWARAKLDNGDVLVWSPDVPTPAAVRYAWADNPTANLYSAAGPPVAPFRTDDFPLSTAGKSY
jgi:sialate O-acetylesterase